jgi:hypothetical protein
MHARYVHFWTLAHTSQVNAKLTHDNQFIKKHKAACQLTHATIRTAFKGGGTHHSPHDLRLIIMDAGTKHQTTDEDIHDLNTPTSHAQYEQPSPPPHNTVGIAPPKRPPTLRKNRKVDVSIDTKTLPM